MTCPNCKKETEIYNTRKQDTVVWRRRRCLICKFRFSTHERMVKLKPGRPEVDDITLDQLLDKVIEAYERR